MLTRDIHEKNNHDIKVLLAGSPKSEMTFEAYHAMVSALEAIFMSSSNYYPNYADNQQHQLLVSQRFDDMEKSLGRLFPLNLRLQVIENIFSILFVRYEDFIDTSDDDDKAMITRKEKSEKIHRVDSNKNNSNNKTTGFLCNENVIREILSRLKHSLVAIHHELSERQAGDEDELEKNISSVENVVADATWRLELLTNLSSSERKLFSNNPDQSIESLSSSSPDRKKKPLFFYESNASSSDESETLEGSSEAGSQGKTTNNSSGSGRRRNKRLKKRLRTVSSSSASKGSQTSPITVIKIESSRVDTLNSMLALKDDLVLQCLWKNDYERAGQVIEVLIIFF